jgi:proteasome lid subunit RPN8/RPN11
MTGTGLAPGFSTWNAPGHTFRIEYSDDVLEQIREIAVDGYHRVPHGGVETGGILFGAHEDNLVRILAWRPIACEYAKGPSFLLSEKDAAVLGEALQAWRGDRALARMEPVGWYRAHTRSEVYLSDADLAFFNGFFPQPWQIGLIVRPASFAPTRAGFFFREADAGIHAESSYLEFTLTPVASAQAPAVPAAPEVAWAVGAAAGAALGSPPVAARTAAQPPAPPPRELRPLLESEPRPAPQGIRAYWKWCVLGVVVLAIAAALGFRLLKPAPPSLALSATKMGGQLRIAWDGAAGWMGRTTGGSIDIDDRGVRTQVKLTPADLRSGSIFYERQSGDVAVRLTVDVPGSPPLVESTRFLRAGESGPAAPPHMDAAKPPEPQAQPETRQALVEPPPAQARPVELTIAQGPPPALPAPEAAKPVRRAIVFRAPNSVPRQRSTDMPSIAPPAIENLAAAPPAGVASVLAAAPVSPAVPTAPRPATTAADASGRIIWTGRFPKDGRLVLERKHASSGAMSGALPAAAARVSAFPGDLTAAGITLFTADPRYSLPVTEKAGPHNGWNPTTYTWDPKRASGIRIVEQPGPQNGYKLVLQSDIPKLSVVVLEWRAMP